MLLFVFGLCYRKSKIKNHRRFKMKTILVEWWNYLCALPCSPLCRSSLSKGVVQLSTFGRIWNQLPYLTWFSPAERAQQWHLLLPMGIKVARPWFWRMWTLKHAWSSSEITGHRYSTLLISSIPMYYYYYFLFDTFSQSGSKWEPIGLKKIVYSLHLRESNQMLCKLDFSLFNK